jgi:hypothetical protein
MRFKRWHLVLAPAAALSCGGADGVSPSTVPSAEPSATSAAEPSRSATAVMSAASASTAMDDAPPQTLDACIIEVLRSPFPGQNIPPDRFYPAAVETFAGGSGDAEKLFSEAYLYTGTSAFVSVALFGHAEIERKKADSIHWHFAIGKYDRILAAKVVEPLRELALFRKAQTLAAVGKREAAVAALVELDPSGKLGRCDASIRPLIAPLLQNLVDPAPTLPATACGDALKIAERLADPTLRTQVGRRCQ